MRVIITGGTGLIGRALADSLLAGGHEVIALSRRPDRYTNLPAGLRAVRWDARTADGWHSWADGADAIVNLAGESLSSWPWSAERKRRFLDSRVHAGRAVVDAVEQAAHKPRVVIQASGVDYYSSRGDEPITEQTPPGSDFLARLCVDWEASTAPVEARGVRRAIIRTGLPLSTRGGALPRLLLPFRLGLGGPFGGGQQFWPWLHMADEVGAIRFLIDHPEASGPFNLGSPNPVTNAHFSRALGRALRRPAIMPVPAPALELVLGDMSSLLLASHRLLPERLQQLGFRFRFPELEPALQDVLQTRC